MRLDAAGEQGQIDLEMVKSRARQARARHAEIASRHEAIKLRHAALADSGWFAPRTPDPPASDDPPVPEGTGRRMSVGA